MKRAKLIILLSFLLLTMGITIPLVYPYPFFSNKYSYKNVDVYSTTTLDKRWEQDVFRALRISERCPWHDSTYRHRVFLSPGTPYTLLFKCLHPQIDGINLPLVNHYFLRNPHIKSKTLGHEMIHTWQEKYLGTRKYLFLPEWIREGYAYYIEHLRPGSDKASQGTNHGSAIKINSDLNEKCLLNLIEKYGEEKLVRRLLEIEQISPELLHSSTIDFCELEKCWQPK